MFFCFVIKSETIILQKVNINGMEIRVLLKNQAKENIRATMGPCTKVLGSLINSLAQEVLLLLIVRNIPVASTVTTFTVTADIVGRTDHIWKEYFSTISTFKKFAWLFIISMFAYIYLFFKDTGCRSLRRCIRPRMAWLFQRTTSWGVAIPSEHLQINIF